MRERLLDVAQDLVQRRGAGDLAIARRRDADAVEKILYLEPSIKGDFRSFFCTASSYGTVGVKKGKAFYEPKNGLLEIRELKYTPRT